jgi:hypothetical protein
MDDTKTNNNNLIQKTYSSTMLNIDNGYLEEPN